MDNMLEHPGIELQLLIKEKGLTQKAFASILGKKVSEVNELLKGKRNITIQRDYLLHQTLGTPIKYWILKQIDYDYSLLDIEETDKALTVPSPNRRGLGGGSEDKSEVSSQQTSHSEADLSAEESISSDMTSGASSKDLRGETNESYAQDSSSSLHSSSEGQTNTQEAPTEKSNPKDDEDLRNRAKIFRTF